VFHRLSATNPVTAAIPVFVADYVLMGYGTGAIMGVPLTTSGTWSSLAVRPRDPRTRCRRRVVRGARASSPVDTPRRGPRRSSGEGTVRQQRERLPRT
jgi:hypothetical protein